ncbi:MULTISPECIES: UDP-glucose 4-epimerase GalE [Pseudoalteromonas]|uniref:UDP-glucose 4-epimerase GalE n=1 Tax=Pseudoalteromonas TaxID=53246 RepID=UPI001581D8FD|nr:MULTISPECIES: UDP-glucose 4-epimerase GalE [Pseudoalteromonas]MDI4651592.1 UDP-glucose 4-epimerase GalE [Pseudoalteromonas shioyasakiensis]NUJ37921.1 UDP-glucose 4-epimerase GalE [Pseudoalteromonas sp. 0303]
MNILVTGGAGYIGSHTLISLIENNHNVIVVDNLVNSKYEAIRRVERITGRKVIFYECDIRNESSLSSIFSAHQIDAVIHFAGLKAVGESVMEPLMYYDNNVHGTCTLLEVMKKHNVKNLVFSSSATVYGDPSSVPIDEDFPVKATNPYGRSKLFVEEILQDFAQANNAISIIILRYFNPVGAHKSGLIGEDPLGIPNNLVPFIAQVAVGKRDSLAVFGNDYPTTDGTGVRDYIHVVDLAEGHVAALEAKNGQCGVHIYNLGTGQGTSVLGVVAAFEVASDKQIPCSIQGRRPGDVAACYAKADKAKAELGWQAKLSMETMMQDVWRWQSKNPNGYL